jgi:predicted ATPase
VLKSIQIKNFKIIEDSPQLSLQPFTILIGRNGSGKSSIVESLDWLGQAVYSGAMAATEPFQRIRDIIRDWEPGTSLNFRIELVFDTEDFSVGDVFYQLEVGASDNTGELPQVAYEGLYTALDIKFIQTDEGTRKKLDASGELSRAGDPPDRLTLAGMDSNLHRGGDLLKDFLERSVFLRLNPRSIASFAPARQKTSPPRLLDEEGLGLSELLSQLDEETIQILIEKLSFIIQGASNLEAHKPESPADRRYFTFVESRSGEKALQKIPAWVLSEGTRRVTAILAILLHNNPPPLICIEEVENGLDPWTLKYLMDELTSATERGTQVILTSHSPYLLNMIPLENIIFCDRKEQSVAFSEGSKLEGLDVVLGRMAIGDLYTSQYLHRSIREDI